MLANPLPSTPLSPQPRDNVIEQPPLTGLKVGTGAHQRQLHLDLPSGRKLNALFPGILEPEDGAIAPLDSFLNSIGLLSAQPTGPGAHKGDGHGSDDHSLLRKILTASGGALQLRNTPLRTAQDFSAFVHTLARGAGWVPHKDKGLMVLRHTHAPAVQTANEGPPDQMIGSHNEYGLSTHYPSYIIFFCLHPPMEGGETPIASSLELFSELQRRDSAYIETLQSNGITFRIHHPRDKVENSLQGNGLFAPDAWGPQNSSVDVKDLNEEQLRRVAEENVRALGPGSTDVGQPDWKRKGFIPEWQPDGSLLVHQRVPGWKSHPEFSGAPTFFNNIHNRFHYSESQGALNPPHHSKTEKTKTGKPLVQAPPYIADADTSDTEDRVFPEEWRLLTNQVTKELQVDVKWQVGDVLVLDNLAVQHARKTWKGPRRLLASLWDVQQ